MAITHIVTLGAAPGANGGVSSAINTTGANLLVVSTAYYGGGVIPAVSDSKTNTWTPLTEHGAGGGVLSGSRIYYCLNPTVGTGHTFTITSSGGSPSAVIYAFSGVLSFQTQGGATGTGTTIASGSMTPSGNGALVISGVCEWVNPSTDTIAPAGFTVTEVPGVNGVTMEGSAAWQVQSVAASINPTWSFSVSHTHLAVSSAVFLPVSANGGGGGSTKYRSGGFVRSPGGDATVVIKQRR